MLCVTRQIHWTHNKHPITQAMAWAMGVYWEFWVSSTFSLSTCHAVFCDFHSLSDKSAYLQIWWSQSREIGCYNDHITLKFDRHLGSTAAQGACQISEWLEKSKPESCGFDTSQDLVVRRLTTLWSEALWLLRMTHVLHLLLLCYIITMYWHGKTFCITGGHLNKKDGLSRYGYSHVKDKTS